MGGARGIEGPRDTDVADGNVARVVVDGRVAVGAALAGRRGWLDGSMPRDVGFLLVSFGGPEGRDDVMPFLRNVTAGRGVPDDRLARVAANSRSLPSAVGVRLPHQKRS